MEELKRESAKEEMCAFHDTKMTCSGSVHRYSFKRCSLLHCFAVLVILGGVFAAGASVGSGHRKHGHGGSDRHGYRGQMMMQQGEMREGTYGHINPGEGRVIMMQRTVGTAPTMMMTATNSQGK